MKNNTIALLVGVLIVISVASILVGPKQISRFSGVTGYATGDSQVTFNMSEEVSVKLSGTINFGAGNVNSSASSATLDSDAGKFTFAFNNISADVGQMPSIRFSNMVFDSKRGVSVLYGGTTNYFEGTNGYRNDTWEFNYSNKVWSPITTASVAGSRGFHLMAYDSLNNKTIVYGGVTTNSTGILTAFQNADTWAYNGTDWTNMSPIVSPIAVAGGMVFDSNKNVTVLFGGLFNFSDAASASSETWEYNYALNNWTNISTTGAPSPRYSAGMVFNPKNNKVYLFGGANKTNVYTDVWTYNGVAWTQVTTSGSPKPTLAFIQPNYTSEEDSVLSMGPFYDAQRDKIIVSVVYAEEARAAQKRISFWEFDANTNTWSYIWDLNSAYGYYNFVGAGAQDSWNNVTVYFMGTRNMFANNAFNETWTLNYSTANTTGSWSFNRDYFYVENDGTVNVSINYTADNDASAFVGGSSPSFMVKGVVDQPGACDNLGTTYAEISSSAENNLCDVLHYTNFQDTFRVAVKLTVPSNVGSGAHNSTITFTGRAVS